jgi:hypothetical protein
VLAHDLILAHDLQVGLPFVMFDGSTFLPQMVRGRQIDATRPPVSGSILRTIFRMCVRCSLMWSNLTGFITYVKGRTAQILVAVTLQVMSEHGGEA